MASKTERYINSLSQDKKNTISIILNACKEKGITNPIAQSAILAIVSKETDFILKGESSYSNTPVSRIRSIFGKKLSNYTDAQIDQIKKDDKLFFSIVYGDEYGNGPPPTQDGWTFRGRGFNQLTFRNNYRSIGKKIGVDLESKPELLDDKEIAAKALIQYYIDNFNMIKSSMLSQYNVEKKSDPISTINSIQDIATAVRVFYQATAGVGKTKDGLPIALYLEKGAYRLGDGDLFFPNDDLGGFTKARNRAPYFYKMITGNELNENQNNTNNPLPPPPPPDQPQVNPIEPNEDDNKSRNIEDKDKNVVDVIIPGLTNIFPPTIKIEPIKFNVRGESNKFKSEISNTIGWKPFVWYNGYQISDIKYFALYNDGLLPHITIIFTDTLNLMKDKMFPLDDTKIKIFLSSRTFNIRHIFMEFKIKSFSIINEKTYNIIGVVNVNGLHVKNYKSYKQKTSFFALQDVCKEIGLGFNSNVNDSNDKMTWINPGLKVYDFINEVLKNAYISDESFVYGYIDYYYNFNYVDIQKELSRNIEEDKGIDTSGLNAHITGDDERVYTMTLSNDYSFRESDRYIKDIKVINNSTSISLEIGYINTSKFYNSLKKELLVFNIDPITLDDGKSIILKGMPYDNEFYKINYSASYNGKMDEDNMHLNYNYSDSLNTQNIENLQKIGIKAILPNPNFNLYKFQKVRLLLTNKTPTPSSDIVINRLSGDWLITDIKFIYKDGALNQELTLIKRELSLSPDELESQETLDNERLDNDGKNYENPIEETKNPNDLSQTDVKIDTIPPPPPGKYDLEYITGPPDMLDKLKDNNGRSRKLVVVDNNIVDEEVALAFLQMREDALKEGIKFVITSGFRPAYGPKFKAITSKNRTIDVTTQESIRRDKSRWIEEKRKKYRDDEDYIFNAPGSEYNPATAPPGKSNHGNGIAIDISTGSRVAFNRKLNDKVYIWLINNSWKYGFVRTVGTEEWHFEYRPKESKSGPYAKLRPEGESKNLYYPDLGLDNIKIS